ncbi:MAG: hypothetical protein IPF99_11825, partial [Deltaproteobacteria bacterium]|nr:hypothetical protein [Deltaproteobacteria bacterium]
MEPTLRQTPITARSPRAAAALGDALLRRADQGEAWIACSLVEGPAVVLGARQRRSAVTVFPEVVRRRTTGTAAWIGRRPPGARLQLPSVDALYTGTRRSRRCFNRSVRPWLRGYPVG